MQSSIEIPGKSTKPYGNPEIIVTGSSRYFGAAMQVIGKASRQETSRW